MATIPVTFSVWEDYQGIVSKIQALTPFGVGAFFILKNFFLKYVDFVAQMVYDKVNKIKGGNKNEAET